MLVSIGFVKCYINNIIIYSLIQGDHMSHLHKVFDEFKEYNFNLHPSKCYFFTSDGIPRSYDLSM
jgi:hypothetical protein